MASANLAERVGFELIVRFCRSKPGRCPPISSDRAFKSWRKKLCRRPYHSKGEDTVQSARRLPKSHPGSAAVFVDELHAGGFQGMADR
jgi:hypothetical protein